MDETMIATHQKQNLNDRIQVRAFGYMVAGVVTKVTDKAIEVTTDNTAGEWKQFSAKIWFPKSALVPVSEKRESAIKLDLWRDYVSLAAWFRPDARLLSIFRSGEPSR